MRNITINLPHSYVEGIQLLVEKGVVSNRSDAIRQAIGEFLPFDMKENMSKLNMLGGITQ